MAPGRRAIGEVVRLVGRYARRKATQVRRWLSETSHLERASVLLFAPLLIAVVTFLSNRVQAISFLLFPPLASGTYTLFADPEGEYASPVTFVGGMTLGALSGWAALLASARFVYDVPVHAMQVRPASAAVGLLLTGILTWLLNLEEPTAFSTALLVLLTGTSQIVYILGLMVSSTFVAAVFVVWRSTVYEERARYLYGTTDADDRVLVPMRTEEAERVARFGAALAAPHDASKVVLLGTVTEEAIDDAASRVDDVTVTPAFTEYIHGAESAAERLAGDETARNLEQVATNIQASFDVPTDVVVAREEGDFAATVLDAAATTDCDLVVAPHEERDGDLAEYVRQLFRERIDVIAFKSVREDPTWKRVMVNVRRPGDVANAMVEYGQRLAGEIGTMAVCSAISDPRERRSTERMLADLVEVVDVRTETRVSQATFREFLERNDTHYDVAFLGASSDRSSASRIVKRPAFERIPDVETDLAIVHRG